MEELEMVDLPLVGRRFTWFQANGRAMSRIDRVLISDEWAMRWGNSLLWVHPRDVSDHCPLILKYSNDEWGPKPFRFNNFWLHNKKFKEVVESFWVNLRIEGWMGFVLKEKLKALKKFLRDWHKIEYGGSGARIEELVVEIRVLDTRGEEEGLSNEEVESRKEKFRVLWKLLKNNEALMFQRARSKWLKEGDANTKFFHGSVKARSKKNLISALRSGDVWLESPTLIKEAVSSYFVNHVSSPLIVRPKLNGVVFPSVSEVENASLVSTFSLEEIEDVVKNSDGNKCPGPDGFNYAFLKKFWDLLKDDFRIMFDQFHGNSCLPKSFLSYFVTLVPKVNSPANMSDFRPISLLGCLYKLIAKVLAKRLAKVIDSVIAPNQSAFIKGRNLVDGVLVVNEVVELAKKSKRECLIFKVDFEKAYDSVDWGFLEYMLQRCGFCEKWIGWIRVCVFAGNLSVLVNGSPTSEINIQRGLKQGDHLAPFLFLLVVEGFSGVMRKAVALNLFKGFSVGSNPLVISHLQYADDTLCIGEATVENLWSLKAILRGFEMASGLKVNFWKSALIGVNVPSSFLVMACSFLNCRLGSIPFIYLGLPIGANPKSLSTWDPLLEHLRKKLFSWRN
ncbi:LINE-1 reverse transcriptase like, partial [Trifolium medium]|nr:LINE-1 reverse transcriptase like [Trifolium medium]